MDSHNRYFRVQNRDLVYMKFILEAYEGLSTMSTVDGKRGIVRVSYPAPFAGEIDLLMTALSGEIALAEVTQGGEPCWNR